MLVGISALTTIGLRRYYAEQAAVPPVQDVCDGKSRCKEFSDLLQVAGIAQEHAVFWGAAGVRGGRRRPRARAVPAGAPDRGSRRGTFFTGGA